MSEPVESLFNVPLRGHPLMRAKEVATALGKFERSTVYALIEAGELEAHRRPDVKKTHLRITRRSVLARLALTATRPLPELPALLLHLAGTLSPEQRVKLIAKLEGVRG